ncbi:MAG: Holliday junction branch migration DNA helicase RuvB, partial [Clostridia bacterium]|nr:Holliday junction branch migration DNA helicase RuvB [Clostridia bacterium]
QGMLSGPLRDRFGIIYRLELYSPEELMRIVARSAGILGVQYEEAGLMEIARRSRGTPRIANRMLKRVRDYAQLRSNGVITLESARQGINLLEVDELGLDRTDRQILSVLTGMFAGRPVGLDTLAAAVMEDAATIEDVYEPYLMQQGLIMRTRVGRIATPAGYRHMNLVPPDDMPEAEQDTEQTALF